MPESVTPDEPPQRWIDTGGDGVSGVVKFSNEYGCWVWSCAWGCVGIDCESEWEATADLQTHDCSRTL